MLDAAVEAATRGWPVFPCRPRQKIPASRHGCLDADTDPDKVGDWWGRHPNHNVAFATGLVFDVLDLDGEDGIKAFDSWCQNNGVAVAYDELPLVDTPSGGMHLYFVSTGAGNRAGMLPHVDWRGRGGYVVAPPSVHPNGNTYAWMTDPGLPLQPVPPALADLVMPPQVNAESLTEAPRLRFNPNDGDGTRYGIAALEDEARRVAATGEGARNHQLNESAFVLFQLVAGGQLTEAAVAQALTRAARCCGLAERETAAVLRSARKAGMRQPRAPRS
jgi:hypothetical protein